MVRRVYEQDLAQQYSGSVRVRLRAGRRDADPDGPGRRVRVPGRRVRVPDDVVRVPDAASASPGRLPGRDASSRSGRGTRRPGHPDGTRTPTGKPGRSGRAGPALLEGCLSC